MKGKLKKAYGMLGQNYYDARKNKNGVSYFYNDQLEFPTTLKLLGKIRGKKILDLGCGPGINAKKMHELGAKVFGIDMSKELIAIAKKEDESIEFKVGDIENLPYGNSEFDIVVSSLVMGHLNKWDKTLREVRRVLKTKGIFIFSIHNPVTEKVVKKKWFLRRYIELRGYFEEGIKNSSWKNNHKLPADVVHYHKTYGTIIRVLLKNKFTIIDYEDCKPIEIAKNLFPKEYKKSLNYPHFCVWKLKK